VGFKTSTVHQTVRADGLHQRRRGVHHVDYLTVEHDAGLDLHQEFILTRDDLVNRCACLPANTYGKLGL